MIWQSSSYYAYDIESSFLLVHFSCKLTSQFFCGVAGKPFPRPFWFLYLHNRPTALAQQSIGPGSCAPIIWAQPARSRAVARDKKWTFDIADWLGKRFWSCKSKLIFSYNICRSTVMRFQSKTSHAVLSMSYSRNMNPNDPFIVVYPP